MRVKGLSQIVVAAACLTGAVQAEEAAQAKDAAQVQESSWTDKISFNGDIRVRLQVEDIEGSDSRERARVRARIGLDADISEKLSAHFRLISGGESPVSANETFDNGASTKRINLDRAYLAYDACESFTLRGGKLKNGIQQSKGLHWDGELSPEGFDILYNEGALRGLLGAYVLDERKDDDEGMLYAAQLTLSGDIEGVKAKIGTGYFLYDNIKGFNPLFDNDGFGNTVIEEVDPATEEVTSVTHAEDYGVFQVYGDATFDVGAPLKVFADYALNTEAEGDEDTGYEVGTQLGKVKDKGDIEVGYLYKEVEADALIGAFTDSDFGGGGTDVKGSQIWTYYGINPSTKVGFVAYINEVGLEGERTDYERYQVEIKSKF